MLGFTTSEKLGSSLDYVALRSSDDHAGLDSTTLPLHSHPEHRLAHPIRRVRKWMQANRILSGILLGVVMLVAFFASKSTTPGSELTQTGLTAVSPSAPLQPDQQLLKPLPGTLAAAQRTAERTVLGTKTGYTIAYKRIPMHLMEPRPDIPNRVYGADATFQVGPVDVHDVFANVTSDNPITQQSAFQIYHEQKAALAIDKPVHADNRFWELDRYKNVYMQALMTRLFPDVDWYITQDADTFLFWGTLMRWLSYFDPKDQLFIGRACVESTVKRLFAQGGSGYIVSKGINDVTYGSGVEGFENKWADWFEKDNWGDSVFARTLWLTPEVTIKFLTGGDPMFFEGNTADAPFAPRTWHQPSMSLHHMHPEEFSALRHFELDHHAQGHADVRWCDVYEKFAPKWMRDVPGWDSGPAAPNGTVHVVEGWYSFVRGAKTSDAKTKDECAQECDSKTDCWMWFWNTKRDHYCELQMQVFTIGHEEVTSTAGYRVDRISKYLSEHPCKDAALREAGWERSLKIHDFNGMP